MGGGGVLLTAQCPFYCSTCSQSVLSWWSGGRRLRGETEEGTGECAGPRCPEQRQWNQEGASDISRDTDGGHSTSQVGGADVGVSLCLCSLPMSL